MHKKKKSAEKIRVKPDSIKSKLNVSVLGNPMLNKPEKKKSGRIINTIL